MDFFNNIRKYGNYIFASSRANLKADVSGSYLNWLWWILEPLGVMSMYAIIFGWLFKNGIDYFPIFIAVGNALWGFFNKVVSASTSIIKNNETLVSKVYLPKYVLLLVQMFIDGFKMLIEFGLIIVLMVLFNVRLSINVFWILPIIIVLMINVFGLGMIMLNIGVYFDDIGHAMKIIMMVWMYFSGIFYDIKTMIPEPFADLILSINGVAYVIDAFRGALLYATRPDYIRLTFWLVIGIVMSIIGIHIVNKNENDYVKRM